MFDLNYIYAQMWNNAIGTFKSNTCEIDPLITRVTDMRRGLTVLSYLDGAVGANISNFLDELKIIEPNQYYYPSNELHLTVLSIISCIEGLQLSHIDTAAYTAVFKETLKSFEGFNVKYKGVTVSPSCILIQGFPDSRQLTDLRDSLRINFKKAKLESTIDSRYKISTAHTTAVRCLTPFENSHRVVQLLSKYREYEFGTLEINVLELVFNNWYQNLSITKRLSSLKLEPRKTP